VRAGKVRYIGSSSYAASKIVEAQWAAPDRRLERFVAGQPPYFILGRGIEADVLPTARRHGMGILSYSPLAVRPLDQRLLTSLGGMARCGLRHEQCRQPAETSSRRPARQARGRRRDDAYRAGYRIRHQSPAVTAAIIGPHTMEQLESQLIAAEVTLTAGILDQIDKLVAPGVTINPDDNSYGAAELTPAALRRARGR